MHPWMWLVVLAWSLAPNKAFTKHNNTSTVPATFQILTMPGPFQNLTALPEASQNHSLVATTFPNFSNIPAGCKQGVNPIYFQLCDLRLAWGIVLEAVAALGILCTVALGLVFLARAPSEVEDNRRGVVVLNFMFLVGVLGLFALVFAFVVAQHTVNCSVRRFLFGVLFSLCFSCLAAHAICLNYLVWHNRGPRSCTVILLVAGLFLVETVINTEWLLITNVRHDPLALDPSGDPCNIAKTDFVMALVYVMFLMAGTLVSACLVLCGNYRQWKRHGAYILVTAALSVAIWVVWIVMYVYSNEKLGKQPAWDDPVLAIALVCNGWTFLLFYLIPEVVEMAKPGYRYEADRSTRSQWLSQYPPSIIIDNKAFNMEDVHLREEQGRRAATGNSVSLYGNFSTNVPSLPLYQSRDPMGTNVMSLIYLPRAQTEEHWKYRLSPSYSQTR